MFQSGENDDIGSIVLNCVANSLLIPPDKMSVESRVFLELGAGSVDIIDILSRLEKKFQIKLLTPSTLHSLAAYDTRSVRIKDLVFFLKEQLRQQERLK